MKKPATNDFWVGFIMGLGLLGSPDGIAFHRLLQRHHVIDNPYLKIETMSDGVFNFLVAILFFWCGIKIFIDASKNAFSVNWRILLGAILMGGGTFNTVAGIVNHHILKIHHVKLGSPHEFLYDLLFLLVSAFLFIVGFLITGILNDITIDLKPKREPEKTPKQT